jgi:exopolysaccharide biosynthesis polyprenyl glycosylphosphotransferase
MRGRQRDTFDVFCGVAAGAADAVAVFAGFLLAVWIRFDSGWVAVLKGHPPRMMYVYAAGIVTLLYIFLFRTLGLYARPQDGHFTDKIPRIVRACGIGTLLATALAFAIQNDPPFSRLVAGIAFGTVTILVLIERNILFQLERHWARHQAGKRRIVIVGAGPLAVHLKDTLRGEPRHRADVVGFLRVGAEEPAAEIPAGERLGAVEELSRLLAADGIDEVIVANPSAVPPDRLVDIILETERHMARFLMVPDVFRLLTSRVDIHAVGDISLLGVGRWPLDYFWNRLAKRIEDIAGALVGLIAGGPAVLIAALAIRGTSPGAAFFRQRRCGENGRAFDLYKLRTMVENAEAETGPVWTAPDDPRRTRIGAFLRRWNIDELPQFWNVLRGDMSLVGPRPERPEFVEQFREHIGRYMWRHVSKPGITGWAQVNGLRGQTDLRERIRYDLWYLENWSLSLDFKILARTFHARKNAY